MYNVQIVQEWYDGLNLHIKYTFTSLRGCLVCTLRDTHPQKQNNKKLIWGRNAILTF